METKQAMDYRLQYCLAALAGLVFLTVFGFFGSLLARFYVGLDGFLSYAVLALLILLGSAFSLILGAVFSFILYNSPAPKRPKMTVIASVLFPVLQVLFCGFLLVTSFLLPVTVYRFFGRLEGYLDGALRIMILPLLLFSVIFTLLAFLLNKKNALVILLIELFVFVLAAVVLFVSIRLYGINIAAGASFGLLQPAVVLLPTVGRWKARMKSE